MPFKRKIPEWLRQSCYHVSSTCLNTVKIFRTARMRDQAYRRLREMKQKFPVGIVDFLLHPDGYRMLLDAEHPGHVSAAMRFFNGVTAQDWKRRQQREGTVWRGRYNLGLVQKGLQTIRCSLDMDFTMARSGNPDLFHPLLWKYSGHHDLTGVRKRYRGVDMDIIPECFVDLPRAEFHQWYINASNHKYDFREYAAETWWEDALAVGSRQYCEQIADCLPGSWFKLCVYPAPANVPGLEDAFSYSVIVSRKRKREYILSYAQNAPA